MAALLHSSDSREPDGTGVAAHAAGKHATGSPLADVGNRYRLIKPLGGTPGDVLYLARHLKSGALVEVRVFTDEHGVSDGLVTALRRLAVDAAAVSEECPGIAALLECERTGEVGLALAMAHQDGITLRQTIRREGGLDPDRAISIALEIAEILQQAHTWGLVHGGLRPENVVLVGAEPTVVLTQYGVDRVLARWTASRRRKGAVVKTHSIYHPPEQVHGDATEQGDIYALGALLYEMLAGSFPRTGIASIRRGRRGPLKKRRPGFTPGLERIVTRTLDPRPQRRPDIRVLCNNLRAEIGATERPTPRRRRLVPERWAKAARASLVGGGLVVALGLGIWAAQAYLVPPDTRWTLP
ncbi:MAG TPA: serine/threonine-protein kinase, partial [Methylomirabilota bacterium]